MQFFQDRHFLTSLKSFALKLHRSSFYITLVATSALVISVGGGALATALNDPGARGAGVGGTGGLVAVEAKVNADAVTLGSTTQVVVRFRNDSSKEIKVGQINLYPSSTVSANIGLNECDKDLLPAGAECAIVVTVKGIRTGNWRVEMLVRHDGRTRIVTAVVEGTVDEDNASSADKLQSDVEAIPNELDFGSLDSSRPIVKSVVLRNVTSDPINIQDVAISASAQSGYSLTTDCAKLEVGQACIATVIWSPMAKGQAEGVLLVQHDGPTKVQSVDLKGKYDPEAVSRATIFPEPVPGLGLMVSSQETLEFGSVTNEASMTVSLVNVGDSDMKINDIRLAGLENGLSISRNGCRVGTILEPIEACPLTLTWAPPKVGPLFDDIQIRHDGVRSILVIPVRGSAAATVNKDTQSIIVRDGVEEVKREDKIQALDGFVVTSHSATKAIINGPGGSRVVTDGQLVTIGGLQWNVFIIAGGVEFQNGSDKVRLLFDRSLSSINRTGAVSTGGTASAGGTASTPAPTPAAATSQ
jgi:hypothetical protein